MNLHFVWKIHLDVGPEQLWRYISDTDRLNQAAGLPQWAFHYVPETDGGSRQMGEMTYRGWHIRWEEQPFQWVTGRHYEVVRIYHNGPLKRFHTAVTLHRQDEGTLLEQNVVAEPRWAVFAPAIYFEIGWMSRRRFERAYHDIETFLRGNSRSAYRIAPPTPTPAARLDLYRKKLANVPGSELLPRLLRAVEGLQDYELDRMRPFEFADEWKADRKETLRLFLHAARAGLLDLSWDVICPGCRGAKERVEGLRGLKKEAHCNACNITYTANFAESVEVTFRPNASVRRLNVAAYCSGGPMKAPHVVAQQRIPPGESRTIELHLDSGQYRLASAKIETAGVLRVAAGARDSGDLPRVSIESSGFSPNVVDVLPETSLILSNDDPRELTVRVERTIWPGQAATAAMVIAFQEFRTLFSEEVLAPDTPIEVGATTLFFTDLKSSTSMYERIGDAPAYALVRHHFDILRESIARFDGAVVKTIGDAVMAAFRDPRNAVEAAMDIQRKIAEDNHRRGGDPELLVKIGIHHGPCIAVTLNQMLDYFGTVVNLAARVQHESRGGDIVLTEDVWSDPYIRELLARVPHQDTVADVQVRGLSGPCRIHRLEFGEMR